MKKGMIIGFIIIALVALSIVQLYLESSKRDEFKANFGFYPSGTNYGLWTGDPNPKLKSREKDLIWKIWNEEEYKRLKEVHQKMMDADSTEYGSLRNSFLHRIENFKDEIGLANHFGYWIAPDDPDGLLKEK